MYWRGELLNVRPFGIAFGGMLSFRGGVGAVYNSHLKSSPETSGDGKGIIGFLLRTTLEFVEGADPKP